MTLILLTFKVRSPSNVAKITESQRATTAPPPRNTSLGWGPSKSLDVFNCGSLPCQDVHTVRLGMQGVLETHCVTFSQERKNCQYFRRLFRTKTLFQLSRVNNDRSQSLSKADSMQFNILLLYLSQTSRGKGAECLRFTTLVDSPNRLD